jgi:hypothetical protein
MSAPDNKDSGRIDYARLFDIRYTLTAIKILWCGDPAAAHPDESLRLEFERIEAQRLPFARAHSRLVRRDFLVGGVLVTGSAAFAYLLEAMDMPSPVSVVLVIAAIGCFIFGTVMVFRPRPVPPELAALSSRSLELQMKVRGPTFGSRLLAAALCVVLMGCAAGVAAIIWAVVAFLLTRHH